MKSFAPPLLLALAVLCGCSSGTDSSVAAAPPSPSPSASSAVPSEFLPACGKPGSTVDVRAERITIRREDCDLRGVTLRHNGVGSVVPQNPGEGAALYNDAQQGGQTKSARVGVDATTGDVTFAYVGG